ncbi:MAG TPA: cyclic pyranopterin monophosphate synthase MoaC [Actinomycetota bacterium]|nr:cyclic pyranopterin monophosphate synthase MoaC [Actinomycetota bacterium]
MPDPAAPALSHVTPDGAAVMVDVSAKEPTVREATAAAFVRMSPATVAVVRAGGLTKGDALGVAKIAGIMAAKRTPDLIPLCHPLALSKIDVDLALEDGGVRVTATVRTRDRTGVEMEALVAASVASLTIYDMCKAVDKGITIEEVGLIAKTGGKSGPWTRPEA